jgi:hypothetical protein
LIRYDWPTDWRKPSGGVGGASSTIGGGRRAEGPAELCRLGLGLGAGKACQNIFLSVVAVLSGGADRVSRRCRCGQRSPLGYPVGVGCRLVTLPRVGDRAGAAWV